MAYTISQNLNIKPKYFAPVVVHLSAGDSGIPITFSMYDGAYTYEIPSGAVISVQGTRKDGASWITTGTASGNEVTFTSPPAMAAVEGAGIAEVSITSGSETYGSANFLVLVERASIPNGVSYSSDPSVFQDILNYVKSGIAQGMEEASAGAVAEWLEENITPTTPAVDKSLTVSGAAADAKAVGDWKNTALYSKGILNTTSTPIDSVDESSIYFISTPPVPDNWPLSNGGWLITIKPGVSSVLAIQFAVLYNGYNDIYVRGKGFNGWGGWHKINNETDVYNLLKKRFAQDIISTVQNTRPIDTSTFSIIFDYDRQMYHAEGTSPENLNVNFYISRSELPKGMRAGETYNLYLLVDDVLGTDNTFSPVEVFYTNDGSNWLPWASFYYNSFNKTITLTLPDTATGLLCRFAPRFEREYNFYFRLDITPTNAPTAQMLNNTIERGGYLKNYVRSEEISCDDVEDSVYTLNSVQGESKTITDFPLNEPGLLLTLPYTNTLIWQFAVGWSSHTVKIRTKHFDAWDDWTLLSSGGNTYEVQQTINRDTITNTYNLPVSPQITTDTNCWLQAVDDENTAEADATDMTSAIMAMLNTYGYCHLSPGTFYVSGNIDMPYGATLEGCGEKTIVRLLSSVNSGYIVRPIRRNTIRGIKFSGGKSAPSDIFTNLTDFGSRHGIYMIGNADGKDSAQPSVEYSIINDCWFEFFDGSGFYAYNTGGGLQQGVAMSSCYFYACRVGINIDFWFEYAKFTDCVTYRCCYACINNGGNNVFTGCTFHGVVGFVIDNSGNDKTNNGHGSCVGCTFNHIDNINHPELLGCGLAVHVINVGPGFIFTGCQLWYGNVLIENSRAIAFSDCLFGNSSVEIEVTGSWPAFFHNNMFYNAPTLNVNSGTKFNGNYKSDGTEITA